MSFWQWGGRPRPVIPTEDVSSISLDDTDSDFGKNTPQQERRQQTAAQPSSPYSDLAQIAREAEFDHNEWVNELATSASTEAFQAALDAEKMSGRSWSAQERWAFAEPRARRTIEIAMMQGALADQASAARQSAEDIRAALEALQDTVYNSSVKNMVVDFWHKHPFIAGFIGSAALSRTKRFLDR